MFCHCDPDSGTFLPIMAYMGSRVVIKSRGPGIFPGYKESGPWLLLLENRRKIELKEIPSRLIPRLLVVFIRQLEILVTTLGRLRLKEEPFQASGT